MQTFRRPVALLLALAGALLFVSCATTPAPRQTGPWNLHELFQTPAATWGAKTGLVQEVYYTGEPLHGKPTRVFGYLGRPADTSVARHPAMVLVHGGGGKAFKDWADHWAQRGYVALAMDLAGKGPKGPLPDGGPDQSDQEKFRNFTEQEAGDMWTTHAVAAAVRAHSLLRSLPDVDPDRIGLTGISWGGYLTCIIAGIDPRFKVAVPVYGCGFLGDNSYWTDKSLAAMTPEARALWLHLFDPSQYVGNARCPMLFVNGTTDFAYPLDSYQSTYRLVPAKFRQVSVAINRPHGHIWSFPEVDAFVDAVIGGGKPLVRIGAPELSATRLSAKVDRPDDIRNAVICYTTNSGPWQKRVWSSAAASVDSPKGSISAELPAARPLVAFLALTNTTGCHLSSEHVTLP